ncbi:Uncharacterised protein [Mycobacterium tuberculosis]|nr:Uncharacterised protein [Mycobacterium tuberculosis]
MPDHSGITTDVVTRPASSTSPGSETPIARTGIRGSGRASRVCRTSSMTAASLAGPSV